MASLACVMLYRKCTQMEYTEATSRATACRHLKKLHHLKQLQALAAKFSVTEGMQPDMYELNHNCLNRWKNMVRSYFLKNLGHMQDMNGTLNSLGKMYVKGIVFQEMEDFNRAFADQVTDFFIRAVTPALNSFFRGSSHEKYILCQHIDAMFLDQITKLMRLYSVDISTEEESGFMVHSKNCFKQLLMAKGTVIPSPVFPISFCNACCSQLYDIDEASDTCCTCRNEKNIPK